MSISSTANTINSPSPCASTSPTSEPDNESLHGTRIPLELVSKKRKDPHNEESSVVKMDAIVKLEPCDQSSSLVETNVPNTISTKPQELENEPRDAGAKFKNIDSDNNSKEKDINPDTGLDQTNTKPSSITKQTTTTTTYTTNVPATKLSSSSSSTTRADLVVNSLSIHNYHQQMGQLVGSKTKPLLTNNQTVANIASASLSSAKTLDGKSTGSLKSANELKAIPIVSSQFIFSSFLTNPATKQVTLNSCAGSSNDTNKRTPLAAPTIITGTIAPTVNLTYGPQVTSASLNSSCLDEIKQTIGHPRRHHQLTTGSIGLSHHGGTAHGGGTAGNAAAARLVDMGKRLIEATRHNQIEQVRQLVVNSGAPFTSDWLGTTALHLAAQNGCAEIAEILLKGGVNRDARTKLERTALHLAAQCGSAEVVDLLVNHGAEIDARDMLKMTPLHWAVERGHISVIERLLMAGADVSLRNKFKLTPIDIARRSEYYEVVELFKNWSNGGPMSDQDILETLRNLENSSSGESHDMLDFDYQFALTENAQSSERNDDSMLNIDEPCIDLVELEWSNFDFEPDLFLPNGNEDEPKVEYLKKIVEELQKENRQLRQKVEQLSSPNQEM